jgi:hypothetical protein
VVSRWMEKQGSKAASGCTESTVPAYVVTQGGVVDKVVSPSMFPGKPEVHCPCDSPGGTSSMYPAAVLRKVNIVADGVRGE